MATTTQIANVRTATGDKPKTTTDVFVGDGEKKKLVLRHENTSDHTVYKNGVVVGGYSVSGDAVTFEVAPDNEAEYQVVYVYSAFSDSYISGYIDEFGARAAVLTMLEGLLADAAKLRDYKEADSDVKNSQIFSQIKQLLDYYRKNGISAIGETDNPVEGALKGGRVKRVEAMRVTPPNNCDISRLGP